ncbi:MAG: hypothetical protein P1Q69_02180 [Candidatus Thorarchaeota archaeon]|nr:hypothetical protein [Candidatus Thorarchaeota archaeon]
MVEKKKGQFEEKHLGKISKLIGPDLEVYDLEQWQRACKAFGPIHYATETRMGYFASNKFRLDAAREMVEFVESWTENLRQKDAFEVYTLSAIRAAIIDVVRAAQEKKGMELGKLNAVKLAGFRTLTKWADNASELKEGPYKGAMKIPPGTERKTAQRKPSRKKAKGNYGPPIVNLVEDYQILDEDRLLLTVTIGNSYMHPYQNVELQLDIDSRLSVQSVRPFSWSPKTNKIPVGFIAASLDDKVEKQTIEISMTIQERAAEYSIGGKIHYDDTQKGTIVDQELDPVNITIR